MAKRTKLKIYLSILVVLVFGLASYKTYLYFAYADFDALNARNIERISTDISIGDDFNFAVVGSVRNSMRIFEKRIAPQLEQNQVDFLISVGDSVYDGAEAKYQLLFKSMNKVGIPFLLSTGNHEVDDFGTKNYYQYFGPFLYSFALADQYFIMLDTTGNTAWAWQQRWLNQELNVARNYAHRFVFMSVSPFATEDVADFGPGNMRVLQSLFSDYNVTAVFSLSETPFAKQQVGQVSYIDVGQAGGLLLEEDDSYQFALVNVASNEVKLSGVDVEHSPSNLQNKYETLKMFLYSFFYMSLFNVLVAIALIGLIILNLYSKIIKQDAYYRDFNFTDAVSDNKRLSIAMFTNNYLPFVGGVPISIDRLRHGLERMGNKVKVFAPSYRQPLITEADAQVVRVPTLTYARKENFPIAQIFSPVLRRNFTNERFDIVHVHHPFLLGTIGLKLAKKAKVPVVFTYHTRMERYTHYFPIPGKDLKALAVHYLIRRFANRCQAVITPTVSTEEYLRNLGVSAIIETIPTGINTMAYRRYSAADIEKVRANYVAKHERLLISVSRLAREKNLDFMLEGIKKSSQRTSVPFKLLLIGDGPERAALERSVRVMGLESIVIIAGSLAHEQVIQCYMAADLFVFSSTSETQGMVLVEAMAGGCPVVAVRASGVHDVIEHGHNGFKVAESTDDWSAEIVNLLNSETLLAMLSDNSRHYAERFSVENMSADVEKLYRRVISKNKAFH